MLSYSYVAVLAADIICFIAGTSLSWSSSEIPKMNATDSLILGRLVTDEEGSWIGSLVPLGAAFGPVLGGLSASKFGRKITLLAIGIPFLVSSIILAFAKIIELFYVARVLAGISVGGIFSVLPMYISEVAEDSNRGALGSSMNCLLCFGLLISYSLGPYISIVAFNLILAGITAGYLVLFFFLGPESAHYYISKNDREGAEKSLWRLRSDPKIITKEIENIENSIRQAGGGSIGDIFKSKGLIKAFVISLVLVSIQQFSGINAVLFYASNIFKSAGVELDSSICSILIGATQFSTSFVTPLVADRLGRKILLVMSGIGMFLAEVPLGVYFYMQADDKKSVADLGWLPILCLISYIVVYNCGFGPLPWTVMAEVFPPNVKSLASTLTASICWFEGFLITKYFSSVSEEMGSGPCFWMFSGFCVVGAAFSQFYLIETKGKSLQEIQKELEN